MRDGAPRTGEGCSYREQRWLERVGAAVARALPAGALRDALRRRYLGLLGWDGGLRAHLPGGEVVRILAEHRHIGWNPAEYAALREAVRPGDAVLDVGANVGAYSVLFGLWVGPAGRVDAFEPEAGAYAGLAAHLALNGVEGVVRAVNAAVTDRTGTAALRRTAAQGGARLADPGNAGEETVRTVSIDEYCAAEEIVPAVIKIDVEGWELEALRGARETIGRSGDRLRLFVEPHPSVWAERGMDPAELRAEMARQGLRSEPLRAVEDPWGVEGECLRLVRDR
jgi:FkbM family methyltransferase